jgi:hypothetical protein
LLGEGRKVLDETEFDEALVEPDRLRLAQGVRFGRCIDRGASVPGFVQDRCQSLGLQRRIVAQLSAGEMPQHQSFIQPQRAVAPEAAPFVVGAGIELAVPQVLATRAHLLGNSIEPCNLLINR